MKIAFTTKGTGWNSEMDSRFGRAEYILVYDEDADCMSHYDNRDIINIAHGAGPQTAKKIFDLGPEVLITGNGPGGNAATVLKKIHMKIYIGAGAMNVKNAYEAFKKKELKKFLG